MSEHVVLKMLSTYEWLPALCTSFVNMYFKHIQIVETEIMIYRGT